MKKLFFFLMFISTTIQSQNFSKVDVRVATYKNIKTPEDLAKKIATDFTTDLDTK